jgi:hypothetical protein
MRLLSILNEDKKGSSFPSKKRNSDFKKEVWAVCKNLILGKINTFF